MKFNLNHGEILCTFFSGTGNTNSINYDVERSKLLIITQILQKLFLVKGRWSETFQSSDYIIFMLYFSLTMPVTLSL